MLAEGVPEKYVHVTGNTGVDALLFVRDQIVDGDLIPYKSFEAPPGRRIVLVTMHRRESFGDGQMKVCRSLRKIASRDDVHMILPVHPNPSVEAVVHEHLGGQPNIQLIEPLDYVSFVDLLRTCHFVITDSGGVQEEGPSLGKPILVVREKTNAPKPLMRAPFSWWVMMKNASFANAPACSIAPRNTSAEVSFTTLMEMAIPAPGLPT